MNEGLEPVKSQEASNLASCFAIGVKRRAAESSPRGGAQLSQAETGLGLLKQTEATADNTVRFEKRVAGVVKLRNE